MAKIKSNGHDITRNGFLDPYNPWLNVSHSMFYEKDKYYTLLQIIKGAKVWCNTESM